MIILAIFMIFAVNADKTCYPNTHRKKGKKHVRFGDTVILNKEDFYGNYNKNEDYSVDDDYYIDKMGTKGYMSNKTRDTDIYDCAKLRENEKKENYYYENYDNIINKLGIYNRQFYDKCHSDYDPSILITPTGDKDPIKARLRFNQGVLFSTSDQIKLGL